MLDQCPLLRPRGQFKWKRSVMSMLVIRSAWGTAWQHRVAGATSDKSYFLQIKQTAPQERIAMKGRVSTGAQQSGKPKIRCSRGKGHSHTSRLPRAPARFRVYTKLPTNKIETEKRERGEEAQVRKVSLWMRARKKNPIYPYNSELTRETGNQPHSSPHEKKMETYTAEWSARDRYP